MYSKEIASFLDGDPTFRQTLRTKVVCAKNQLETDFGQISRPGAFFVNTESSESDRDGHWVCVLFPTFCRGVVFFDPLGKPPCKEICTFMKRNSDLNYRFSDFCFQKRDDSCGQWCLHFALTLLGTENFYTTNKLLKRADDLEVVNRVHFCHRMDYLFY